MIKKIGILALLATLAASMTVTTVMACTWTPGYWKNHPEAWGGPFGHTFNFAGTTYDVNVQADRDFLMDILWRPVKGDVWLNLAQKYIALQLSLLDAGFPSPEEITMTTEANAWLTANSSPVSPRSSIGQDGLSIAAEIDAWLNLHKED